MNAINAVKTEVDDYICSRKTFPPKNYCYVFYVLNK